MNLDLQAALWGRAIVRWSDVAARLRLPAADRFPLPFPPGDIDVTGTVEAGLGSDAGKFRLRVEGEYEGGEGAATAFLGFELGSRFRFSFVTGFEAGSALNTEANPPIQITGEFSVEVRVRFPELPGGDLVRIQVGGEDGWMPLTIRAIATTAGGEVSFRLEMSLGTMPAIAPPDSGAEASPPEPIFAAEFFLPGIAQAEAPFRIEVDRVQGSLEFAAGQIEAELTVAGRHALKLDFGALELPATDYLRPLLQGMELGGSVEGTLALTHSREKHEAALRPPAASAPGPEPDLRLMASLLLGDQSEISFNCQFRDADVNIYPFDLLRQWTTGVQHVGAQPQSHAGLGFGLRGICLTLGPNPSFAVQVMARIGVEIDAYVQLTKTELRLGLGSVLPGAKPMKIPFTLPMISRKEFGFLANRPINDDTRREGEAQPVDSLIYGLLNGAAGKERYNNALELFFQSLEFLTGAIGAESGAALAYETGEGWQVKAPQLPNPPSPEVAELVANLPVQVMLGMVAVEEGGELKPTGELAVVCKLKTEAKWRLVVARPALVLHGFYFSVAFQNPRNIRLGGTASFHVDGPLAAINNYSVSAGISADLIYFALESEGLNEIVFDFVPGYEGSITIGKLMLGFGYAKRSFAIAFAGELKLPERLVDDLDTTATAGAGIRLPVQSKLAFQFDVMPIYIGKAIIPLPTFQFNIDFRRDGTPGIRDPRTCEPYWDGLQLILPGVVRCAFKRLSYNPFLGLYASSNSDIDGDLVLGDDRHGFSIIADNIFWAYGPDSGAALTFYPINGLPFCDNFCLSVRLGEFRLNFNLQRPIPSFSPLAIFEVLALLCDPMYPIAPRGELASTIRASLTDAYLVLPEPVRAMFPQSEAFTHKVLDVTINLADFLALLQGVARALKPAGEAVLAGLQDPAGAVDHLQGVLRGQLAQVLRELPDEILGRLPVELRRWQFEADFAGFSASAVFALCREREARVLLAERDAPPASPAPANSWATSPNIGADIDAPRMHDPSDPAFHLFAGEAFDGFTAEDLAAAAAPASDDPLEASDITLELVAGIKGSGALSRYLRGKLSATLRASLSSHKGHAPMSDGLKRDLARQLNATVAGEGVKGGTLHTAARFKGVSLSPEAGDLLARHKKRPLSGAELFRLNRSLFESAYVTELPDRSGVVVAARVRVFGEQRFRFLGQIWRDGSFVLISALDPLPLTLTVAGMTVPIPLQISGRLRLEGQVGAGGVGGVVRAEGRLDWEVMPGLLRVRAGVAAPAILEVRSNGRFSVAGDADATLFGDERLRLLEARFNASETHGFVSGRFRFAGGRSAELRLFRLDAAAEGRIGPGGGFRIAFSAESDAGEILGIPMRRVKGAVSQDGIELEAELAHGGKDWSKWPGSREFQPRVEIRRAVLRGWIYPQVKPEPDFGLEGELALRVFGQSGPEISGRGRLSSTAGRLEAMVEGVLRWQDRDWLRGRIELQPGQVRIAGEVSLVFAPPASGLIQMARPVIRVDLSGSFNLAAGAQIAAVENLRARCVFALAMPGNESQPFPIAMAEYPAQGEPGYSATLAEPAQFSMPLLRIKSFMPMGLQVRLPKPTLTESTTVVPTGVKWENDDWGNASELLYWGWDLNNLAYFNRKRTLVTSVGKPVLVTGTVKVPNGINWGASEPVDLSAYFSQPFTVSLSLNAAGTRFVPKLVAG